MILDYYFSKSGEFYEVLYEDQLINRSFSYSTTLERNFGYSFIGGNTNKPKEFSDKVIELLLSTQQKRISEGAFRIIQKKKLGQLLRALNSLEYIANQATHYKMFDLDLFSFPSILDSLTVEDANGFLEEWIQEDK